MLRLLVLTGCFLVFTSSSVFADFYRWVDTDGREFFTNDPQKIPEEYRDRAATVRPDASRVSVTETAPGSERVSVTTREHRDKRGRGEEYWRRRAKNLRLKLRDKQDQYDQVLRRLEDEERKRKKSSRRKTSSSAAAKKKVKLEREIASIRRELEVTLPEEARKAEAYPGWIRE